MPVCSGERESIHTMLTCSIHKPYKLARHTERLANSLDQSQLLLINLNFKTIPMSPKSLKLSATVNSFWRVHLNTPQENESLGKASRKSVIVNKDSSTKRTLFPFVLNQRNDYSDVPFSEVTIFPII